MPTSPDILLADEITEIINEQTFSQSITAERVYVADWDEKEELSTLKVAVWPGEMTYNEFERDFMTRICPIGFTFAQKVSAADKSVLDGLCDLVHEVETYLSLIRIQRDGHPDYVNLTGAEYLVRFDDGNLTRNKGSDGNVKYTGLFASMFMVDFRSLE